MEISNSNKPFVILLADDNPADRELTRRNLEDSKLQINLFDVEDGVEAMEYLERKGSFSNPELSPRPDIILLDINMPRLDGKKVLENIKSNPDLTMIPVIMLTTSSYQRDIFEAYKHGVSSYIKKPVELEQFKKVIKAIEHYWFNTTKLPSREA